MKQIDVREGALRQHRVIALFALVQCWQRKIDGVVFMRRHMERLIGLKKFKSTRIEWMQEDIKDFFPYQEVYYDSDTESFGSFYAARFPIAEYLPTGSMTDKERLRLLKKGSPKLERFKLWGLPDIPMLNQSFDGLIPFFSDQANYDERLVSTYLMLLAQGQISITSIPPYEEGD